MMNEPCKEKTEYCTIVLGSEGTAHGLMHTTELYAVGMYCMAANGSGPISIE